MNAARKIVPAAWILAAAGCAALLTGCGSDTVVLPLGTPTAAPPPSPTTSVGYAVLVTAVPTKPARMPVPTPRPTRFVPPAGPWLLVSPASGPPLARTVHVTGGNLPHNAQADLLWSPEGHVSPLGATAYTDGKGRLSWDLAIPDAQPGTYFIEAQVGGIEYARARYRVISAARVIARYVVAPTWEGISAAGRGFLARTRTVLIAYPVGRRGKPVVLGEATTDAHGQFTLVARTTKLSPGQYVLRAWTISALSAQMAETFFQVDA